MKRGNIHGKPIHIGKHRIAQIRNYVHTERRREVAIRSKQGLSGNITHILVKWKTRQLEASLKKLQEAADNNDMKPIWQFQSKLRMATTTNRVAIKNKMGPNAKEWEKRWKYGKNAPENVSVKNTTS